MPSQDNREVVCPESTLESANRRNFIRKAALATTAIGIGGTLLGKDIVPESSASSSCTTTFCTVYVKNKIGIGVSSPVYSVCSSGRIQTVSDCDIALFAQSSCCRGAITAWGTGTDSPGINSQAFNCGPAVFAKSLTGPAFCGSTTAYIVGRFTNNNSNLCPDSVCRTALIQLRSLCCFHDSTEQWNVGGAAGKNGLNIACGSFYIEHLSDCVSSGAKLTISKCGKVGIGTVAPTYQLEVVAPNQNGILIEGPSSCVGASLHFQTTSCCPRCTQGWEILDTGCKAGQGQFKLNIRNLNTSKDVFTICGPNSNIGINNTAPFSSYALCVNGTISGSSSSTAVFGSTTCGIGVLGCSTRCGIGVWGQGGKVGVEAVATTAGAIPIVAKGASGQTANLQQWENSSGTVYAVINKAGSLGLGGVVNPHHVLCISGKAHASSGFSIGPCTCINTTLAVNGSFAAKTRTVGSTSTIQTTDYAILATGTITLTLPPAKTQNGMTIFIKNTSTGTISVVPGGTDSIEGSSTARTLTKQYDSLTLISNGTSEWFIQSGVKCGAVLS